MHKLPNNRPQHKYPQNDLLHWKSDKSNIKHPEYLDFSSLSSLTKSSTAIWLPETAFNDLYQLFLIIQINYVLVGTELGPLVRQTGY